MISHQQDLSNNQLLVQGKFETLGSNFSQETAPLATGLLCYNRQSLLTNGLSSNHAKLKRLFKVARVRVATLATLTREKSRP